MPEFRRRGGPHAPMAGLVPGDSVDNQPTRATDHLAYTLEYQGGGIPGGCHGVQCKSSSQPFPGRDQVRDRRAARQRRPAGLQPASRIPRWNAAAAAGKLGKGETHLGAARAALAPQSLNERTRPSSRRGAGSAFDRRRACSLRAGCWKAGTLDSLEAWLARGNPGLRWAGVNGRSVNRLMVCLASHRNNACSRKMFPAMRQDRRKRRAVST
jgi:hypothetical protein